DFCTRLRERFPGAEVIQADAFDLDNLLAERQLERIDHVFCELPMPWFPLAQRHRLLDSVRRHLTPGGTFRQLTYMPWLHANEDRGYFRGVGFRWVFRNLPRGGFFLCRGPRRSEGATTSEPPA